MSVLALPLGPPPSNKKGGVERTTSATLIVGLCEDSKPIQKNSVVNSLELVENKN